jgi:hypothetical protein
MGGDARWTAAETAMDGNSVIAMDGSSGNGQRWRNGWRDGGVIVMGEGMAVARWMAHLAADDRRQCRSSTMGGDGRWKAVAITIDGGMIGTDGGSGNE